MKASTRKLVAILFLFFSAVLLTQAQPGAIDLSFNPADVGFGNGDGADNNVYSTALQADGKVLIVGDFANYNGIARSRIARLNADGTLDAGFNPGTGANDRVSCIVLQSDGKILIGGDFTSYNGTTRNRIARLNADGTLDATFNPGAGANNDVLAIALQPDGKILIGGTFISINLATRYGIARLNANGTLDGSFNPAGGVTQAIRSIVLQPDGKILIGGEFTSYNGTARNYIARLSADGTLDAGFNPGIGANNFVWSIALQPDGKMLIGGEFTSYNGTSRNRVARINANGSLDAGFNPPGTGPNSTIYFIAQQSDGKMVIGGVFTNFNGTSAARIARLNADGTLDGSFSPSTGANSSIRSIVLQPDGKILIGGDFTGYNGTFRARITRVNANGTLDTGFSFGTGANNAVRSIVVQPDGKTLIGGDFTS